MSQLIDTFIINFLVWSSQKTPGQILGIIGTSYVTKVAVAIGLTPFIYAGHALVERGLKLGPAGIEDP